MAFGKQIGIFLVFSLVLGMGLFMTIRSVARGTAPPLIETVGPPPPHLNDHLLRIATANLAGVSVLGFDWSEDIDERFAAMEERLSTNTPMLDVVLLQEAWKDMARHKLLAHPGVMRNFPYRVDITEQPGGSGLVILSRLPIEQAFFHRFKTQGECLKIWEGDCISGKGVLAARLSLGDHSIWIGNTHLIACYTQESEPKTVCDQQDPNGDYRWQQVFEARRTIEGLVGEQPAIFGGDFNFTRTSRYYPLMTAPVIPSEAPEPLSRSSATNATGGWAESNEDIVEPSRLDYFWTRPGREFRWYTQEKSHPIFTKPVVLGSGKQVPLSDHPVLMTTLCVVRVGDQGNHCLPWDKNSISLSSR